MYIVYLIQNGKLEFQKTRYGVVVPDEIRGFFFSLETSFNSSTRVGKLYTFF